jgi:xylitol oxidase
MQMSEQMNWAGNLTYSAAEIRRPRSVDELRAALHGAGPVSVLGSRHCFNDIADTTGTLIALAELPSEIEFGEDSVRISGGLRYGDIAPVLRSQGRALANLASLPHISVAGAIATGTHGSGDRLGSLATTVRSVTLMDGRGETREFRRGDAEFPGIPVHLGALGIVTELELDTEPDYQLRQFVFEAPSWDAIFDDLDAVTGLGDSVSIFTTYEDPDRADQLWVKTRADAVDQAVISQIGATAAAGPRHPIAGVDPASCNEQLGVPGSWSDRLPHFRLDFTPSAGEELQSEFLVARENGPDAIRAILELGPKIAPLLYVSEIRTVMADDLWLSPSYGRDSVALHFTWNRDEPAVRALLPEIEAALAPFDARPHWGKIFTRPGREVAAQYPRFGDFGELRARLDPEGRFLNDYLRRLGL